MRSSLGEFSPGPLPKKRAVRAWHFYDTEFGYDAKGHTNVLKQRLSVGVVSWVEFEDGTRQVTLAAI
jgi:hypothetical protein